MDGGAIGWTVLSRRSAIVFLASAVWIFPAAAWSIRVVTTPGKLVPAAPDTRSYLEPAIRRSTVALRMLWLASILFVCEMAFCLTWIYRVGGLASLQNSPALSSSAAMIAAFAAFVVCHGRKKRAERDYFVGLVRELES
jgi:hypothetical protein